MREPALKTNFALKRLPGLGSKAANTLKDGAAKERRKDLVRDLVFASRMYQLKKIL